MHHRGAEAAVGAAGLCQTTATESKMDPLERLRQLKLPFADLLGIEYVSAAGDRVVAEMTVRPELCTAPAAVLHGGAIMAFADTLGAAGTFLNLPEGVGTTTIESKTNFIAGAPVGARLTGETTPLHRGRRTQVWQTRITTAEGRLVAVVTQTQMVLSNN
jgi:1,4-dihydroxy-2-naphthoyl-CoA hydrolase